MRAVNTWWQAGQAYQEMLVAAQQVIAARSLMLSRILVEPQRVADPEFQRMVQEKQDTALAASAASAQAALRGQTMLMTAWRDYLKVLTSPPALAATMSMGPFAQWRWLWTVNEMTLALIDASQRGNADGVLAGVKPYRQRALANAKRLGRKAQR